MKANWKLLLENSADIYHGMFTHMRFFGAVSYTHLAGPEMEGKMGAQTMARRERFLAKRTCRPRLQTRSRTPLGREWRGIQGLIGFGNQQGARRLPGGSIRRGRAPHNQETRLETQVAAVGQQ